MTLWFPKTDLMFHEVQASRVGRFKMWVHFTVFRTLVYPILPWSLRMTFYEAVRRWVFGPNANHEDLRVLLHKMTKHSQEAG